MGPNIKGQYSFILNYATIISLVLNLGIGQSYTYFQKIYGSGIRQKFINLYYLQFLLYFTILLTINIFYRSYNFNTILFLSILSVLNSQINFMSLVTNVNKRNVINIASTFIYIILLLIIYFAFDSDLNLILLAFVIKLIANTVFNIFKNDIKPEKSKIEFKMLKKVLKFSFFPMVTSLLITFNYNLDIIILERYVAFSEVGIYSVGVSLATILWVFPDAFKDVLFNKTARSDSIEDIKFSIKFNVYLSIITIIGFFLIGQTFINFLYGIEYANAYSVTLILFIGSIPMIFFKMINTLYISIGKQLFAFYILAVSVIVNIILNILLIPSFGIEGAAIASVMSYFICGTVFLISFSIKYKIKIRSIICFSRNDINRIKNVFSKMLRLK